MQTQQYERINVLLPKTTAKKLREQVPAGQRSKVIAEALEEKLASKRGDLYKELLRTRKTGPKVSWEEVVKWVREDRESH